MSQTSVSPVPSLTTVFTNTTTTTLSQQQILIQSSGAMIAVIVIGIIIILTILLIILKTYNRYTHESRVLGVNGGSKSRQNKMTSSTAQSSMPLSTVGVSSLSGSIQSSAGISGGGFRLPRAEVNGDVRNGAEWSGAERNGVERNGAERNDGERNSTHSGSTVVTIHSVPTLGNA